MGGRADQAGLLYAAANTPVTFQRTLMPRATMDQALVTGLSASANHALVTLVQDAIQSTALVLVGEAGRRTVDEKRWSRATIAADVVAIGAGIAIQRALRARNREPLARAGRAHRRIHARGDGNRGRGRRRVAGSLPRQRLPLAADPCGGRSRGRGAGGLQHLAGAQARAARRAISRARTPKLRSAKSIAYGVGMAAALSAFGGPSVSSPTGSHASSRGCCPGTRRCGGRSRTRPRSRASTTGARVLAVKALARIEQTQESAEAAFDFPPPNPLVSGSLESLVPFDTLSRAGRRFVWMAVPTDKISEVMGEPARANPVRAYVGLESAPSEQERVDLAMRELERTGAFDRSWLMIASPTGTGYVNYAATSILEFLTRGDCASVAMQYSARPSPLSLDRVKEGRLHTRMLCQAIAARCAQSPAGVRPKVLLFGESLGAWTSQDGFVDQGTQGLVDAGIDYAIWIGTPHFSKWKERVLYDDRPDVDRSLVGRFNDISEWEGLEASERERIRFVMITHYDDGVGVFGPELAIQAPDWLCDPAARHPTVPKSMRWMPATSFFQVLVDMKNAANVVPGAFAAKGHDYRADLLPFFHGVLGLKASPEQLDAIHRRLEARELFRSRWAKDHKSSDKGLAAEVLARFIREERAAGRDTDERLLELVRAVAIDEFDAV